MKLFDTLQNLVSGLGTSKDKTVANTYVFNMLLPDQLMNMYRGDWIARKVIDIIPEDITRTWRLWKGTKEQITALEAIEKNPRIILPFKTKTAMQHARLLGGSVMYFGIKGQSPTTELNVESVGKDDLQYVHTWSKLEVGFEGLRDDIGDPWYGQPDFYSVSNRRGEQVQIHPSRCIRFLGMPRMDILTVNDGWSDSVLQVVYDAIVNASSSQQHVAGLIPEAKTDVMYIPGLGELLSTPEGTRALTARFQYANVLKSQFNMVLLDGVGAETAEGESVGETWEQKQIRFADLPDLLTHFLQAVSGAGGIPLTRFLGVSPAGLNATGESDLRQYYDTLAAKQTNELGPSLSPFDEVIKRSAGIDDPNVYYCWAPMWTPTEVEAAQIFERKANGIKLLSDTALIPAEALSKAAINAFVEDGSLPGLEAAIEEFGGLDEQEPDVIQLARGTTPPPAPPLALPPPRPGEAPRAAGSGGAATRVAAARDAAPRSLYVSRNLLNGVDFLRWAHGQGFEKTLTAADLHVTILYSRQAVDWMAMGEPWNTEANGNLIVKPGGARIVEPLGDQGAVVLLFGSSELSWRHTSMVHDGASHDYDEYQPHVTITYQGAGVDLEKVEPYVGQLIFGPEIFQEIKEDYTPSLTEEPA